MSLEQNAKAAWADITALYNRLNTERSRFSFSTITPSNNEKIVPMDIINLKQYIQEMTSNSALTQTAQTTLISEPEVGALIKPVAFNQMSTIIDNIKNTPTNSTNYSYSCSSYNGSNYSYNNSNHGYTGGVIDLCPGNQSVCSSNTTGLSSNYGYQSTPGCVYYQGTTRSTNYSYNSGNYSYNATNYSYNSSNNSWNSGNYGWNSGNYGWNSGNYGYNSSNYSVRR